MKTSNKTTVAVNWWNKLDTEKQNELSWAYYAFDAEILNEKEIKEIYKAEGDTTTEEVQNKLKESFRKMGEKPPPPAPVKETEGECFAVIESLLHLLDSGDATIKRDSMAHNDLKSVKKTVNELVRALENCIIDAEQDLTHGQRLARIEYAKELLSRINK